MVNKVNVDFEVSKYKMQKNQARILTKVKIEEKLITAFERYDECMLNDFLNMWFGSDLETPRRHKLRVRDSNE